MALRKVCASGGRSRRRFTQREWIFGTFFVLIVVLSCSGVNGFFIDLEALGFNVSKGSDENASAAGARDDSSGGNDASETSSKVLIAAPSEQQQTYEVESKTDPHKSVKLTLAELKQLVLGTVKDLTPNTPPINIKIVGNRPTTTTTPKPSKITKINKYKYKDPFSDSYKTLKDSDTMADEEAPSYWERPSSDPSLSIVSAYDDGTEEHYSHTNEVVDINFKGSGKLKSSEEDKKIGWMDAAKAVFKGPSHVVNSYSKTLNRWRSTKPKKHAHKRPRPLPDVDITYPPSEARRRRKRPPPRRTNRRPFGRPRSKSRIGQRRRGHYSQKQKPRLPSHYNSDMYETSEYYDAPYSSGYYTTASDWERIDHFTADGDMFDSTRPNDDTPYNMNPPPVSHRY